MCSVQYLRDFIKERLTAACEQIFSEVQKTVVQYEEEISRQRRLLDIIRRPDTHSHITDLPQLHDCEEEKDLDEQQICNLKKNSSLDQEDPEPPQIKEEQEDPEPPQIKEEQEELCSSQNGEQLGLKLEADGIWSDEERLRLLETMWKPEIKLDRIDLLQKYVYEEEEEILTDKQVCNQKRKSTLGQKDPKPPQVKEEQETLSSSLEREQLGLKQEADIFMVTPTYEERDHNELEPNSEQLLSHSSSEAESPDQEENQHVDSGSTTNAKLKKMNRNRSHSQRVHNAPVSKSQSEIDKKKSLQCDTCGKILHNRFNLTRHLRIHTGEKPYWCETCGKRFADSSGVIKHMRVHTGEKPYSCNVCGKRFSWRFDLERHRRVHPLEIFPQASCKICGERFKKKSVLKTHVRIHTDEKPYLCSTCGKRFSKSKHLKKHLRIHAGSKFHI